MSSLTPQRTQFQTGPESSPLGQQVAGALSQRERVMVRRLLGNPLEFPAIFNGWLESRMDALYQRRGQRQTGVNPTSYSATPPPTPNNGDLWVYPVNESLGWMWTFRYRAAAASAYKWEFVGGPPYIGNYTGAEASATRNAWYDTATITRMFAPRGGDYFVQGTASVSDTIAGTQEGLGLTVGATGASNPAYNIIYGANYNCSVAVQGYYPNVASGGDIRMRYASFAGAGTATWTLRVLTVWPIRVS